MGRAGAAEIAYEEATNVEARSKGMSWSCRNSVGRGYNRRSEIVGRNRLCMGCSVRCKRSLV